MWDYSKQNAEAGSTFKLPAIYSVEYITKILNRLEIINTLLQLYYKLLRSIMFYKKKYVSYPQR